MSSRLPKSSIRPSDESGGSSTLFWAGAAAAAVLAAAGGYVLYRYARSASASSAGGAGAGVRKNSEVDAGDPNDHRPVLLRAATPPGARGEDVVARLSVKRCATRHDLQIVSTIATEIFYSAPYQKVPTTHALTCPVVCLSD
jgi:hypothetical protein